MPSLSVSNPQFADGVDSGVAVLEKPITLGCAAATFPNGAAFGAEHLGAAGFFIYRKQTAAAVTEVWNEETKAWAVDPGASVVNLKVKPFFFKQGDPFPWQGLLVAAGQKDGSGNAQFQKAVAGTSFPQYFFRAYFSATQDGVAFSGLSAPSAPAAFVGFADAMLAGLGVGEDETPADATEVQVFLRNTSRTIIGKFKITDDSQVEIANFDASGSPKARIILLSSGDVEIRPAAGKMTKFFGFIEYEPADAPGIRQLLNTT